MDDSFRRAQEFKELVERDGPTLDLPVVYYWIDLMPRDSFELFFSRFFNAFPGDPELRAMSDTDPFTWGTSYRKQRLKLWLFASWSNSLVGRICYETKNLWETPKAISSSTASLTSSGPVGDASSPVGDASSPVGDVSSPVGDVSSPVGDASSPGGDASNPVGDASSPVGDSASPVGDSSSSSSLSSSGPAVLQSEPFTQSANTKLSRSIEDQSEVSESDLKRSDWFQSASPTDKRIRPLQQLGMSIDPRNPKSAMSLHVLDIAPKFKHIEDSTIIIPTDADWAPDNTRVQIERTFRTAAEWKAVRFRELGGREPCEAVPTGEFKLVRVQYGLLWFSSPRLSASFRRDATEFGKAWSDAKGDDRKIELWSNFTATWGTHVVTGARLGLQKVCSMPVPVAQRRLSQPTVPSTVMIIHHSGDPSTFADPQRWASCGLQHVIVLSLEFTEIERLLLAPDSSFGVLPIPKAASINSHLMEIAFTFEYAEGFTEQWLLETKESLRLFDNQFLVTPAQAVERVQSRGMRTVPNVEMEFCAEIRGLLKAFHSATMKTQRILVVQIRTAHAIIGYMLAKSVLEGKARSSGSGKRHIETSARNSGSSPKGTLKQGWTSSPKGSTIGSSPKGSTIGPPKGPLKQGSGSTIVGRPIFPHLAQ